MHKKKTIEEINEFVIKKGGVCLSKEYKRNNIRMSFRCEKNHIWETTWSSLQKNTWCPVCRTDKDRLSIDHCNDIAKLKKGKCLSTKYKNSNEKLSWECGYGHTWNATLSNIKQNQWCPTCSGKRQTILDMQAVAKYNYGKCLSNKFNGVAKKLTWQCYLGHEWDAVPNSVKRGSWCPYCSSSLGEKTCKIILENLLGYSFNKIRPKWISNQDDNKLELDGYCSELDLAFEYNGRQHYTETNTFKNTNLEKIQLHDKIKKTRCEELNINLIIINEQKKFSIEEILNEIKHNLDKLGIQYDTNAVNLSNVRYLIRSNDKLDEYHKIAKNKKGKCLSDCYINSQTKLKFICKNKHTWEATPNSIKNGHWCSSCYHKKLR